MGTALILGLSIVAGQEGAGNRPPAGHVFLRGQITAGNYSILRGQTSSGVYVNLAGKVA